MRKIVAVLPGCLLLITAAFAGGDASLAPKILAYDERFHDFIDVDSRVEILGANLGWAEGPVWVESLDSLLFSDVASDTIFRWNESRGLSPYLKPSGHPPDDAGHAWRGSNGLAVDAAGRLLLAQQGNRVLSRMRAAITEPASDFELLAGHYQGKRINSPNDLVVHAAGDIYFTDPPYGLAGFENSPDRELPYSGVFRLTAGGQLSLIEDEIEKPNGIALSVDQSVLFVSNSEVGQAQVFAFALDARGNAFDRRVFFDARALEAAGPGSTDGMAMHRLDYLFVTIPNGFGILSPQGDLLGKVALGQVTNLAFDDAFEYLYLTTPERLLRIQLKLRAGDG
jgi:gluconolactonase